MEVLLVEDSPGDMFLARRALATSSFEIELTVSQTGQGALELLDSREFDLILLDINLWDMTGLSLLEILNERLGDKVPPVFILSGTRDESDKELARSLGAIGFSGKPESYADYAELVKTIDSLVKELNMVGSEEAG